jgi:iturin family lipopeptide synthetase A
MEQYTCTGLVIIPHIIQTRIEFMSTTKNEVIDNLKNVIAGVYEMDSSDVDATITFLEMGMDSISIIQVKQLVKNVYGLDVPVDRLFDDIANLDTLADFIMAKVPASVAAASPVTEAPKTTAPLQAAVNPAVRPISFTGTAPAAKKNTGNVSPGIQQIINEQLLVMQRQMEILSAMAQ